MNNDVFDKARSIVDEIILNVENKPFSLQGLYNALEKEGAIKRVAPGVTIEDYIKQMLEDRQIRRLDAFLFQRIVPDDLTQKTIEELLHGFVEELLHKNRQRAEEYKMEILKRFTGLQNEIVGYRIREHPGV